MIAELVVAAALTTCLRDARELGIPQAQAQRICNPQMAKPDEWGWQCDGGGPPYKVKGGIKFKRDVLCE